MKYYIKTGDEIHGPLDAGGVRLLMAKKDFKDSHLIRPEGEELWVPLGSIEEFNQSDQRPGREISPLAVASIALAFSSVLLLFLMMIFPVPLFSISSLAAVIFGHLALRRMKQHPGHVREYGMARGGLWLGYFLLLFPLAVLYQGPGPSIQNQGNITKAISNCRQIITTLRIYSSDHEGKYPDAALPTARSSNAVFRRMFVDGEADNEQIFGSPASVFFPDGNIGTAPDYREALQAGENHWAMTKGLTDSSDGNIPLVFENPSAASWPPRWNADRTGTGKSGRTWSNGRIIIGLNDGSVSLLPLEAARGEHVTLRPKADGTPVFPKLNPTPEILQVDDPELLGK